MGFLESLRHDARNLATSAAWGLSLSELKDIASQYPAILSARALRVKTRDEMEREAQRQGSLKRTLGPWSLILMGVGFMAGAGIFVTPGTIAADYTGPAVCISYLIAALSATLSCFCYAEFACDMPLAGAAYNYIAGSLGEFFAWVVTSNLLFEYILADAALVRSFAPYFAVLLGLDYDYFLYDTTMGGTTYTLDWLAFSLTLLITGLVCMGAKESTTANTVITVVHLAVMAFIIIAGFTQADTANFKPFFPDEHPQQWKQLFNGAAIAFFSFIGFDAVATAAEEVKNPSKHMPTGILGSISIVTIIYFLMCVVLCLMVPRDMIDPNATFAAAFTYAGLPWATHIVALGALLGIVTGILIGIYAPARILAGCCREGMLPPFLAWIGPKQTPWVATWVIGICVAVIALLTDFEELANMVSIGTFVVFWFVALALLWRRFHVPGQSSAPRMANQVLHLCAMVGFSLGFVLVWNLPVYNIDADGNKGAWYDDQWKWLVAMAVLCAATPLSMALFCKPAYTPQSFVTPLFPLVPCGSIFVNTFLTGQLNKRAYRRFGWWTVAVVVLYLLYGVFAAEAKDRRSATAHGSFGSRGRGSGGSEGDEDVEACKAASGALALPPARDPVVAAANPLQLVWCPRTTG
ncbi:hypothetical protein HYH03_006810 [Edaphochlamys debaryana]|uniref:Cationic amino acid transporter C-terminal domain-containing protein n=1 Tax=Edaphochlamys debaryana TaxID=47281 RepID=A0A836C163_9CHLO|nr:hypothetical protein HYH03_006810 [Edaphochlamys debaryana]|eukprot:KAG2495204.1 hypothetical protein HYH03_006810 [Edaphochlamys debaryana]